MSDVVGFDGAADTSASPAVDATAEWRFEFRGNAAEYFRIWIVNLGLSIVTLGVFSAWAKVRRERYFYGNTWVAGAPFEYLANPINILKGRIVAVTVFGLYAFLQQVMPIAQLILLVLVLMATPWVITSALRFRARYSAWNTATFRFTGTVQAAVRYYLLLVLLMVPTFGTIYPYVRWQQRRFMVGGHRFGGQAFVFGAGPKRFYAIFGVALAIGAATFTVAMLFGWGCVVAVRYAWADGGVQAVDVTAWRYALTYGVVAAMYFSIFVGYVYVASRVTNVSYNTTTIGPHRLRSTIRMRDLVAIYLTNTAAIVASIGLLVPWAQIRLARYRAAHLRLLAGGDLHDWTLETGVERSAFGAETANVFDLDISL